MNGLNALFLSSICLLGRVIFSLRYKVTISVPKNLSSQKKGLLFLPNHSSRLDPLILTFYLWPKFRLRPIAVEYISRLPFVRSIIKALQGISIPNFDTSINQYKIIKAEEGLKRVAEGLKEGDNFLLYPAGRLKRSGKEIIGGSSGAHELLNMCPGACPVLVRQIGFWGSRFSHAVPHNDSFSAQKLWEGAKGILQSFLFFCPRRKIDIVLEVSPKELPVQGPRRAFNQFLEQWYNRYPDLKGGVSENEPFQWVPASCWHRKKELEKEVEEKKETTVREIPSEIEKEIFDEIRQVLGDPVRPLHYEQDLFTDLGMDSIDLAQLLAYASKRYRLQPIPLNQLKTIRSLLEAIVAKPAQVQMHRVSPSSAWRKEKGRLAPKAPSASTLPEALAAICRQMGSKIACADDTSGEISYRKFLRASLVLAQYFQQFPEKNIGVMLPASVGAFILAFGIIMAGKVPVFLNWTLGPRALGQMVDTAEIQRIVTSWQFMERLNYVEFGETAHKMILIEDIRAKIRLPHLLRGIWSYYRGMKKGVIKETDPAVILFTSGSEGIPKGVPLTHRNLLQTLDALLQRIYYQNDDILLSILPPFHSMGFALGGVFPILAGLKTAFFPNPTDIPGLAEAIQRWGITWIPSPSFFIKELLSVATTSQLKTLRYVLSGGERTPESVHKKFEELELSARILEGYGTTECSPCISSWSQKEMRSGQKGAGRIFPGVKACTIDPETGAVRPEGAEGELCIYGENVFSGYLNNVAFPFIQHQGKRWYRTGDLGRVDAEGNIFLSGRLKRFIKIGGEMISLAAIEEALTAELAKRKGQESSPELAICDVEEQNRVQLVLFCTAVLTKEEVAEMLKRAGFSNLIRISAVCQVRQIPILGSGKVDYTKLKHELSSNSVRRKAPNL